MELQVLPDGFSKSGGTIWLGFILHSMPTIFVVLSKPLFRRA